MYICIGYTTVAIIRDYRGILLRTIPTPHIATMKSSVPFGMTCVADLPDRTMISLQLQRLASFDF